MDKGLTAEIKSSLFKLEISPVSPAPSLDILYIALGILAELIIVAVIVTVAIVVRRKRRKNAVVAD